MEAWLDRIRDRHVVSVQAARPRSTTTRPVQRTKRGLGAGIKRLSEYLRTGQLELLERLKRLEQASSRCVPSDGGTQSAGQTENSFGTIPDDFTGFEAS